MTAMRLPSRPIRARRTFAHAVDKFVTNASRRFVTAVENSLTITSEDRGIILELLDISRGPACDGRVKIDLILVDGWCTTRSTCRRAAAVLSPAERFGENAIHDHI